MTPSDNPKQEDVRQRSVATIASDIVCSDIWGREDHWDWQKLEDMIAEALSAERGTAQHYEHINRKLYCQIDRLRNDWKELHRVAQEIGIEKSKLQARVSQLEEALKLIAGMDMGANGLVAKHALEGGLAKDALGE